jgi:hypothetical protein
MAAQIESGEFAGDSNRVQVRGGPYAGMIGTRGRDVRDHHGLGVLVTFDSGFSEVFSPGNLVVANWAGDRVQVFAGER